MARVISINGIDIVDLEPHHIDRITSMTGEIKFMTAICGDMVRRSQAGINDLRRFNEILERLNLELYDFIQDLGVKDKL